MNDRKAITITNSKNFQNTIQEIKDTLDDWAVSYEGEDGVVYIENEGTLILEFIKK